MVEKARERLPVILDHDFRKTAAKGALVEIYCDKTLENNGAGAWLFYLTDPEDGQKLQLIVHGKIKPKVYTTLIGAVRFMKDIGFRKADLPLYKGDTVELKVQQKKE